MRDCENCKHKKENGCEKWECEFEPKMTIEEAASYIKKYLHGEIIEIIDGDPKTTNKEFMCVITALEVALRSFEAWEKAKAKLGNYSLYPVNEWVGLKRAMKIVLETLGEVGETDG